MINGVGDNSQTQMGYIISNDSALPSIISDDSALPSISKNEYRTLQARVAEALSGLASSGTHVRNLNERVGNFDERLRVIEDSRSPTSTGELSNAQLTALKADVRNLYDRVKAVEDSSRVATNAGIRLNDMANRLQGLEDTQASLRGGVQQNLSDLTNRVETLEYVSQVTSSSVDEFQKKVNQSQLDLATLWSKISVLEQVVSPLHNSDPSSSSNCST